jgi:hypothetical protein
MPVRSHVDPVMFVRFMHIRGRDVPEDLPELLAQAPDQARYLAVWRRQQEHAIGPIFHECYHFWQGARLPYLYWYATLALRAMYQVFASLSRSGQNHHEWEALIPALYRLQIAARCVRRRDGTLVLAETSVLPKNTVDYARLSPLDLMEAAASIAEYQFLNGPSAMADPLQYSRWRKRNRSYANIPAFVGRVLENDALALRCFVPMVNASFGTSDPPRAFSALLSGLRHIRDDPKGQEFISQPEPCRWPELMDQILDEVEFEASPEATTDLLDPPFCRLTMNEWLTMRFPDGSPVTHPILSAPATEWARREADDPAYSWLLDQPAWVGGDRFWEAVYDLGPPVTVVRFHLPDGPNRVLNVASPESEFSSGSSILDLLTILAVVRRATGINFDPDGRLCHHVACPEYADNYCNAYSVIPDDYHNCGFPRRLQQLRDGLLRPARGDTEQ